MTHDMDGLVDMVLERAARRTRFLIAVAGPPGAGKSTLAEVLAKGIVARGESVEILPMDGFHMDNVVLRQKGSYARKGAPDTFDVRGFLDIVQAVRKADQEVLVPLFDRSREQAIAAARIVSASTRFVIVEGNYLLLDEQPWAALDGQFDMSVLISPPVATLEDRLMDRWRSYGFSDEDAKARTQGNDLKNGQLVRLRSRAADIVLED